MLTAEYTRSQTTTHFSRQTINLAHKTGGHARADLTGIWDDLPVKRQYVEIAQWLIIVALVLFLLEILQRRTGILTRRRRYKIEEVAKKKKQDKRQPFFKKTPKSAKLSEAAESSNDDDNKKDDDMSDTLSALRLAAHQAGKRLERK